MAQETFAELCRTSEVIEQDRHGIKVLMLGNGNIFKVFRVKRFLSSAQIYSYARRFCDNAERLQAMGIPTMEILQLYHLTGTNKSAVEYRPLQGHLFRQLAQDQKLDVEIMRKLGRFIAKLHSLGVYFRSLHQGNIVLTPEGDFGLIDIADMRFYSRPLPGNRRISNFRHFAHRSVDELRLIPQSFLAVLLEEYASCSGISTGSLSLARKEVGLADPA